jgi:acyl-CoA thioester hydrolase
VPRIEIEVPGKFLFSTPIPIRIGDINRANHLSHVNLVQIIEEARAQFLTST